MTIQFAWNNAGYADIVLVNGGISNDTSLEPYVIVSLFSDRRADTSFDIEAFDASNNLRGWWADSFRTGKIGSSLWQFDRTTVKVNLLSTAKSYVKEALQWMLDANIVSKITVNASMLNSTSLGIAIELTEPTGFIQKFNYSFLAPPFCFMQLA